MTRIVISEIVAPADCPQRLPDYRANPRIGEIVDAIREQGGGPSFKFDLDIQMLLDVIPFYVRLVDADHKIILANKAMRRDLGLDPNKVIGSYCPKVVHGTEEPYPGCPLEQALDDGQSVEREFFNSENGRWVSSAIYPTGKLTKKGKEIFVHFVSDITGRKNAEEEVRKNYDILKVITRSFGFLWKK